MLTDDEQEPAERNWLNIGEGKGTQGGLESWKGFCKRQDQKVKRVVLKQKGLLPSKIQDRNEHYLGRCGRSLLHFTYKSNSPNNLRKIELLIFFGEKKKI